MMILGLIVVSAVALFGGCCWIFFGAQFTLGKDSLRIQELYVQAGIVHFCLSLNKNSKQLTH